MTKHIITRRDKNKASWTYSQNFATISTFHFHSFLLQGKKGNVHYPHMYNLQHTFQFLPTKGISGCRLARLRFALFLDKGEKDKPGSFWVPCWFSRWTTKEHKTKPEWTRVPGSFIHSSGNECAKEWTVCISSLHSSPPNPCSTSSSVGVKKTKKKMSVVAFLFQVPLFSIIMKDYVVVSFYSTVPLLFVTSGLDWIGRRQRKWDGMGTLNSSFLHFNPVLFSQFSKYAVWFNLNCGIRMYECMLVCNIYCIIDLKQVFYFYLSFLVHNFLELSQYVV